MRIVVTLIQCDKMIKEQMKVEYRWLWLGYNTEKENKRENEIV